MDKRAPCRRGPKFRRVEAAGVHPSQFISRAAFAVVAGLLPAPALAATYAWPLQVSIPVSLSGVPVSTTNLSLELQCKYYPTAGGGGYQFNDLWVTPSLSNSVASFSKTLTFTVYAADAKINGVPEPAPLSGDKIVCNLVTKSGAMQANGGTTSTLVLP